LKVVTSFLPAYCFAVNVAGQLADVENLTSGSVGPHDAQLAPKELRKLERADVLVVNGLGLDTWWPRVLRAIGPSRRPAVVELAAGLDQELIRGPLAPGRQRDFVRNGPAGQPKNGSGHALPANPHIWLDPVLACRAVTNVLKALQAADPPNAAGYARQAEAFCRRLARLDGQLRAGLAALKEQPLVTFHDAFPYFIRRYNLNLVGVIESIPDVEPSPKHLDGLLKAIREAKVKVIFTEPQFADRLPRQIARDAGLPLAQLDTLETGPLTATAYEEGLRRNLRTLRQYLQ
jgi:ABC-type Zn uptake system ZnuABC Zn-binding protein ZnuA